MGEEEDRAARWMHGSSASHKQPVFSWSSSIDHAILQTSFSFSASWARVAVRSARSLRADAEFSNAACFHVAHSSPLREASLRHAYDILRSAVKAPFSTSRSSNAAAR